MSSKKRKSDDSEDKSQEAEENPKREKSNSDTENEKVKKEDEEEKPKIKKSSSKKNNKKKSSSGSKTHQPPGYSIVTADNSSGRTGRCKVVVKMSTEEGANGITDKWLSSSPAFQILNDKGAKGSSVMIGPDAIDLMDAAATTVLDTVILNSILFHHIVESKGLATNAANGVIVHPEEQSAKGKKLSEKGKYVIKPYSVAMAVQMNENLREVFGDVKLPDDSRPPTVVGVDSASAADSKDKKSKKGPSSSSSALDKVLAQHGIKV